MSRVSQPGVYLDANASEPLRPAALEAMLATAAMAGNPSSIHAAGRAVRRVMEQAREDIAACLSGAPDRLVFTSGGTEANAAALHALSPGRVVIVVATEHDAVRSNAPDAIVLPVGASGMADPVALAAILRGVGPALVCAMLANNETGVIHPVSALAKVCHEFGAWLHVDAVQAAGRMTVDMAALGADSLAVSSHKVGGPAGGGAWLLAAEHAPRPLVAGGGQERGWRGGTPPAAILAGFAAALREPPGELSGLRDAMEAAALACGAVVVGGASSRLHNTCCVALPGVAAQTQVMALDLAGICVSAGAACSSGRVGRSHVLEAMGLGDLAGQTIRVSLPWNATPTHVEAFAVAYRAMAARLAQRAA